MIRAILGFPVLFKSYYIWQVLMKRRMSSVIDGAILRSLWGKPGQNVWSSVWRTEDSREANRYLTRRCDYNARSLNHPLNRTANQKESRRCCCLTSPLPFLPSVNCPPLSFLLHRLFFHGWLPKRLDYLLLRSRFISPFRAVSLSLSVLHLHRFDFKYVAA